MHPYLRTEGSGFVIDDEPPIRRLLRTGLATQGFEISEVADGASALRALRRKHDLMILNLGLPDFNGLELLRQFRANGDLTPVVVLTSRGDEPGKVEPFDLGADDYVTKPLVWPSLSRACERRFAIGCKSKAPHRSSSSVDLVPRIVRRDGADEKLSPKEFELLRLFVQNADKVLTHAFILRFIWGANTDPQQLRVYIRQLRRKIERTPECPGLIGTETGVGYRLHTHV